MFYHETNWSIDLAGVYSLGNKLANKKVKEVSWPPVQSSRGVWTFFPHSNAFDMTIITSIFGWVLVALKCIITWYKL